MGRFYSIPITRQAVSTIIDLWELLAASGKPFYLHEIRLGQASDYGDAAAEGLAIEIKRGIGNTSGSGGSSGTAQKHATNDAAGGVTAEILNTTQAVAGGGSLTTIQSDAFNAQAGYQYLPPPEQRLLFLAAESCIISLQGASGTAGPADELTVSGNVIIEEL